MRNFIIENLRGHTYPCYITVLQLLKTYYLMIYSFTKFYRMGAEVLVYFYDASPTVPQEPGVELKAQFYDISSS